MLDGVELTVTEEADLVQRVLGAGVLARLRANEAIVGEDVVRTALRRVGVELRGEIEALTTLSWIELEKVERPIEFRFSVSDAWSRALLVALLRRYGIEPYRYRGQRHTTVTAKVTRTFVNEVLWPEFQELNRTLREHLESVTARVIRQAIHKEGRDVHERPPQKTGGGSKQDVFSYE